jgi:hypothetical protein
MTAPMAGSAAGLQLARDVWDKLLPSVLSGLGALNIGDENFSLALDPARYPVFPAADGGKIVIDAGMTLSPLVKTILQEKDPGIRFVTATPGGGPRFFSPLLAAARFYSVEENVFLQFGVDPQLSINADFKIEKSPDSLLRNEVVLLNTAEQRAGLPEPLVSFLAKEGFQVVEFTPPLSRVPDGSKVLYSITTDSRQGMVDELFAALSLRCERDRQVVLDDGAASGVMLTVRAQRYHEGNGRKTVISFSEGNPVQYTLLRLLALKGYQVVMVGPADDFKATAAKVLAALDIPAHYGMQSLGTPHGAPFAVQLSGVSVHGRGRNGSLKVLTGRSIDPLVRDLATAMGFDVVVK